MSLIGSTLLNEIIRKNPEAAPAEMLHDLHHRIVRTLRQDSGNNSRDGMDMILCRFDKTSMRLLFSSAGRPLFHVSKNELTAYRASSSSIGGSYDFLDKNFHNHEVFVSKGDMIALFSDGYPDQFGMEIPKKYSSLRVKQLCLEIADLDPETRSKRILESYFGWKGETEQIDDVLFVTIKV
jgi:serine phosphatase RsbU (regulator of sigma subunit)